MAGGIRVTPEILEQNAGTVMQRAGEIDQILGQLTGQVESLGGDWAGAGEGRFQQLFQEWQRSQQGVHEALVGISQLLGQASQRYAETEAGIAASFSR